MLVRRFFAKQFGRRELPIVRRPRPELAGLRLCRDEQRLSANIVLGVLRRGSAGHIRIEQRRRERATARLQQTHEHAAEAGATRTRACRPQVAEEVAVHGPD